MSIAINLLPDVRLARIRAQHIRHVVTGVAVAIWIIVGIGVVGLFLGIGAQKLVISNVNNQIAGDISSINGTKGLNDALTAQQTLINLPSLYSQRTYFSKFVPYIAQAMPPTVTVASIAESAGQITINGQGTTAYAVDQFYESLKVANKGGLSPTPFFSNVTLTSVSIAPGVANFTVNANVSPGALNG